MNVRINTTQRLSSRRLKPGDEFVVTVPMAVAVRYTEVTNVSASLHAGMGYAVAQLVEALGYKQEGSGFDFRWCHWNISLT
jgi:hypothetical protein